MAKYFKFGSWSISILHYSLYYWNKRELVFLRPIRWHQDQLAEYLGYKQDERRMYRIWNDRIVKDAQYMYRYGKEHEKNFRNVVNYLNKKISKVKSAKRLEILRIFNKYWSLLFLSEPIGDINHTVDEIYTKRIMGPLKQILYKIGKEEKVTEYMLGLTTPWESLPTQKEDMQFLLFARDVNKGKVKDVNAFFQKHLKQYAWIPVWYDNKPWDINDLKSRLNSELKFGDFAQRINRLKNYGKSTKLINRKQKAELKVSGRLLQDIDALRYFTYIRNLVDLHTGYIVHKARPIYEKIANFLEISFDELKYLTPNEIRLGLKNKLPLKAVKSQITQRQKFALTIFSRSKQKVLAGLKAKREYLRIKEEIQKESPKKSVELRDQKLSGIGASLGKAKGRARVIKSISELNTMKEDEILIVPSTSVDFVGAMKKSVAVVTEIGGITCHAAIVSRELGKPCIVNTLIATKVFKTGDLVEVDANKGIVRKLT